MFALLRLYENTNDQDGWKSNEGWDREAVARLTEDHRRRLEVIDFWTGVTVTSGRLSHLSLVGNNLHGPLPIEFFLNLVHLKELNLSRNTLTGVVPEMLSGLKSLTWLDLSENRLSGKLPKSIGTLSGLKVINFSGNTLTNLLPSTLNRLIDLRELHCDRNDLCGELPAVFAEGLRYCEELKIIDLSCNPRLGNVERFQCTLRMMLPGCSIFVGSAKIGSKEHVQSFGEVEAVRRIVDPKQLEPLDEDSWELAFKPPWES